MKPPLLIKWFKSLSFDITVPLQTLTPSYLWSACVIYSRAGACTIAQFLAVLMIVILANIKIKHYVESRCHIAHRIFAPAVHSATCVQEFFFWDLHNDTSNTPTILHIKHNPRENKHRDNINRTTIRSHEAITISLGVSPHLLLCWQHSCIHTLFPSFCCSTQ